MKKTKKTERKVAKKATRRKVAKKEAPSRWSLKSLTEALKAFSLRLENVERAKDLAASGPIIVGRYGKEPVCFSEESTVRYVVKGQAIDVRVEPESHLWFSAEKGKRLNVNLGNGVWFPVGGMVSIMVSE